MDDERRRVRGEVSADGALGVVLAELTIMNDLRERLERVTADQVAASNRRFNAVPKKAKVIDSVTNDSTRALHALWMSLDSEAELESAKAKVAVDEHIEKDHREKHALLEILGAVAREMFWAQAKMDLGVLRGVSIGIYKNWTLVEGSRNRGIGGLLQMIGGGGLPMPGGDEDEDE